METVEDLKNDIAKTNATVKFEQKRLQKEIENGLFDSADEILSNPKTNNYYQKALEELNKETLEIPDKTSKKENEKTLWKKFKENLKKIILQ